MTKNQQVIWIHLYKYPQLDKIYIGWILWLNKIIKFWHVVHTDSMKITLQSRNKRKSRVVSYWTQFCLGITLTKGKYTCACTSGGKVRLWFKVFLILWPYGNELQWIKGYSTTVTVKKSIACNKCIFFI